MAANTVIQLKRSTTTATPTNGSLNPAEPAYSYNSGKLFIGSSDGATVVEIGGKYYVDHLNKAYEQANAAYNAANTEPDYVVANAAFAQANAAYDRANTAVNSGNANAVLVIAEGAYAQANTARDSANAAYAQANAAYDAANNAVTDYSPALIQANAAYNKANSANQYAFAAIVQANAAYDKANSAYDEAGSVNSRVTLVGAASNTWANLVASYSNTYAETVGTAGNTYARTVGTAGNTYAETVGTAGNSYARTVGTAGNTYADTVGAGANAYATSTYVKLTAQNQTLSGNLTITGALTVSGNAFTIDTTTLNIADPLIYLAGNNYTTDAVDIGFVGNYNDGTNKHAGVFRDSSTKEFYVFHGYTPEPGNDIDTADNSFTLGVLNASIRTSNLNLAGANAVTTLRAAFDTANASNGYAGAVGVAANAYAVTVGAASNGWANTILVSAYTWSNTIGTYSNTYAETVGTAGNTYARTVGTAGNTYAETVGTAGNAYARTVGAASNNWANLVASYANTYADAVGSAANTNASDGSYISTGIVRVAYGGTGATSHSNNYVLLGNTTGSIKSVGSTTEGHVLKISNAGLPEFGMLDGGTF